ncbi:hypothetical protein [Dongshaea marina]|nr:hypothetical protein [Dongshaea marina]
MNEPQQLSHDNSNSLSEQLFVMITIGDGRNVCYSYVGAGSPTIRLT